MMMRHLRVFISAAALVASAAVATADQDGLAAARDLYAAAAYEDALAALDRLQSADRPVVEARAIEQYRAMCFLALGRGVEAERAIRSVIERDPSYQPADVSPRIKTAFSDVRRRVLPDIARQRYAAAKAAYERKDFSTATAGFADVLHLLDDPDLATAAAQPPLSDVRTLAAGFHDLSAAAETPVPVPATPPVVMAQPQVTVPVRPDPARIYGPSDANVVPPVAVRQELPPYPGMVQSPMQGAMEVVIDENGAVVSAIMKMRVSASYDGHAVNAAKTWRYRPATIDGTPVKYRKTVVITVKPNQ